jgi:hypothetical protein
MLDPYSRGGTSAIATVYGAAYAASRERANNEHSAQGEAERAVKHFINLLDEIANEPPPNSGGKTL